MQLKKDFYEDLQAMRQYTLAEVAKIKKTTKSAALKRLQRHCAIKTYRTEYPTGIVYYVHDKKTQEKIKEIFIDICNKIKKIDFTEQNDKLLYLEYNQASGFTLVHKDYLYENSFSFVIKSHYTSDQILKFLADIVKTFEKISYDKVIFNK